MKLVKSIFFCPEHEGFEVQNLDSSLDRMTAALSLVLNPGLHRRTMYEKNPKNKQDKNDCGKETPLEQFVLEFYFQISSGVWQRINLNQFFTESAPANGYKKEVYFFLHEIQEVTHMNLNCVTKYSSK